MSTRRHAKTLACFRNRASKAPNSRTFQAIRSQASHKTLLSRKCIPILHTTALRTRHPLLSWPTRYVPAACLSAWLPPRPIPSLLRLRALRHRHLLRPPITVPYHRSSRLKTHIAIQAALISCLDSTPNFLIRHLLHARPLARSNRVAYRSTWVRCHRKSVKWAN